VVEVGNLQVEIDEKPRSRESTDGSSKNSRSKVYPETLPSRLKSGNRNVERPTSAERGEVDEVENLHDVVKKKICEYNPEEKVNSRS